MTDGTLIAVEGIDGAGKTTVVDAIETYFAGHDREVVTTAEPTDMWTGDAVYNALSDDDMTPVGDFAMFVADRARHVATRIQPALDRGAIVVTDRYADSTRAYQTHRVAEETDMSYDEARGWINTMFEPWNVEPDLTIYIDIPVDVAMERCGQADKYEKRDNLERVRDAYDDMYHQCDRDVRIIDGRRTERHVRDVAINTVKTQIALGDEDSRGSADDLQTYADAIDEA